MMLESVIWWWIIVGSVIDISLITIFLPILIICELASGYSEKRKPFRAYMGAHSVWIAILCLVFVDELAAFVAQYSILIVPMAVVFLCRAFDPLTEKKRGD